MERDNACERIRNALRLKEVVADTFFDRLYPDEISKISSTFWTPVKVARCASEWLTAGGATRVLDIGAGVGKFCIVGALTTGVEFVGVEHRPHLVAIARQAVWQLGVKGVRIIDGSFATLAWDDYQAYYFFNPFQENVAQERFLRVDDSVELSPRRFHDEIDRVQDLLARAPIGARVATYHGFGGEMPAGYQAVQQPAHMGDLRYWLKVA